MTQADPRHQAERLDRVYHDNAHMYGADRWKQTHAATDPGRRLNSGRSFDRDGTIGD